MLARLTAAFLFLPAQQVGAGASALRRFLPSNIRSIRIGLIRFQLLAFLMTPHQLKVFLIASGSLSVSSIMRLNTVV